MIPSILTPAELASKLITLIPVHHLSSIERLTEVAVHWLGRQRYWHGPDHLLSLLTQIHESTSGESREILSLVALYHDAIYDPRASNNEALSAALLNQHALNPTSSIIQQAAQIIRDSAWTSKPADQLTELFFELDTCQLSNDCSLAEQLTYELAIFREYQWATWKDYQLKREAFLQGWGHRFPEHHKGITHLIDILHGIKPRIAVYPGSFDPFHWGHLSVLRHAEMSFDKVIIAAGINSQKNVSIESLNDRHSKLQKQLRYHEVAQFSGLLSSYLNSLEFDCTVVRGVRDGTDLEMELRFSRFLNELRPFSSVVWISCEPELQHLSSGAIRELSKIEPQAENRYIPDSESIYNILTY